MIDNLLDFFNDIKHINLWDNLWKKKIVTDSKGLITRLYERKFRSNEVKEICKDNKNNVLNIKEYRYDEDGILTKVVTKNSKGSIEYVNEIVYDEKLNIKEIYGKGFTENIIQFCEYDAQGKIVCDELIRRIDKTQSEIISKNEYDYDEEGLLLKVKKSENTDIIEEYIYDADKNVLEIAYRDRKNNIVGQIGYAYKDILLQGIENIRVKSSINFKGINKGNKVVDKFHGEYDYDDKHRIITDFTPVKIKGVYGEESIKDFDILFLKERYVYEKNEDTSSKTILEDEKGKVKQQCYYNEEGKISKVVHFDNDNIVQINEYIYE